MFCKKDEVQQYADDLANSGIVVTARWFLERTKPFTRVSDCTGMYLKLTGEIDVVDIDACDVFVLITTRPDDLKLDPQLLARGGRHWECGYAHAKGKTIVLFGPRENTFHYFDGIMQFDTWEEVRSALVHTKINRENYRA
jgi:nucleoside 2-deoxyribosyltransferase